MCLEASTLVRPFFPNPPSYFPIVQPPAQKLVEKRLHAFRGRRGLGLANLD